MKKTSILLVLILLAGGIFAHETGDIILNIEPQGGGLIITNGVGYDLGLRATFHYHFTQKFSVNAGLGFGYNNSYFIDGGNSNETGQAFVFLMCIPGINIISIPFLIGKMADDMSANYGNYSSSYITIPIGLRFSPSTFVIGGGATFNIPVGGKGSFDLENEGFGVNTYTLEPLFNVGWYVDLGLDFSKEGKKVGFGVMLRVAGAFSETYKINPPNNPFYFSMNDHNLEQEFIPFSVSVAFQIPIVLANKPIGGN